LIVEKEPTRILRIIARLNIGGPAIQAVTLSHEFSEGPYRTLLVCGQVSSHEGDMSYLAESKGVKPVVFPSLGREISVVEDARCLTKMRNVIRRFRPHIIHTHTAKAGTVGRLGGLSVNLARENRQRIRLVHTFHGHVFHDYFGSLKTRLFIEIERFLARFTDRIVVISPLQKRDICETYRIAGPDKVCVVPLGFDLSPYMSQAFREKGDSSGSCLVGIVGRLTHVKNHRLLLEAARDLKDHGNGEAFKFLVVGDGELRAELVRYAAELGVEKTVTFTGWKKDMPSIYGMLDAVALTSLNEGTPVTLIEAMAAGKPVIATDVGGVRDLLGAVDTHNHGGYKLAQHGILIPSGKREALTKALLFASENRGLLSRMTEQARSFVLREFCLERMTKDLDALYRELMQG
jgi:glycosyltransferase involved in cell wall biosynthesis